MKINYHKSEVVVYGPSEEEQQRVADMLGCQLGTLPMKYLGLPISDTKLVKADLHGVVEKQGKRLGTWKTPQLSMGGRLILINSSLTSLPMYAMLFYRLPEWLHAVFDSARARFYGVILNRSSNTIW